MLALGKTVSDIAEELSLSQKTIRELRARMMDKMKFRNTVELARYAIENQLVD
jgi:DNA-binding NarL/FixJ family response regulator